VAKHAQNAWERIWCGGSYVIYKKGLWEIVSYNKSPDEDLRPAMGWASGTQRRSTWSFQHRFGPKHPEGRYEVHVEIVGDTKEYEFANAMEVLAYASIHSAEEDPLDDAVGDEDAYRRHHHQEEEKNHLEP